MIILDDVSKRGKAARAQIIQNFNTNRRGMI